MTNNSGCVDSDAKSAHFRLAVSTGDEMTDFLAGQQILVVEDDYYLADDTAQAVRRAGAKVLGPCANEQDALDQIKSAAPTAALLDINLGLGPCFEVARILMQSGVPLIFITGYDAEIIPAEFAQMLRLEKPVQARHILNSLAQALGLAGNAEARSPPIQARPLAAARAWPPE